VQILERLALTHELVERLGVPAREALTIARSLLDPASDSTGPTAPTAPTRASALGPGPVAESVANREQPDADARFTLPVGRYSRLVVDHSALKREIQQRLEFAIESVVRPRRGRPRSRP
jgi:hypothetical protein